jgi:phosphoribosylformimino-5-aminoimidazole carboxamide ribotide isomerase
MIQVIPAIDIIDGKCVRLSQGDFTTSKIYNSNPVEVAKQFQDNGIQRLHLVDLDGAKAGSVKNWDVLHRIANETNLQIDFGGGIASTENVISAFNSGAMYISIGSVAIRNRALFGEWLMQFGVDKFLLGADVKDEKIVINGWQQTTSLNVFEFISDYRAQGIMNIFCTDVSTDGMMKGPSLALYKKILQQDPKVRLIASGGVSSVADIEKLVQVGCFGAIVGKAIYEGSINLNELRKYAN